MRNRTAGIWIVALGASLFTGGCFEPDRAGYVEQAAKDVCREAQRCDNLGEDGFYPSYDECIIEEKSRFNSMWPADDCDDGRIDSDRFDSCMNRARLVACDGGLGDWLAAAEHCSAARVCID